MPDVAVFFVPLYLVVAVFAGVGIEGAAARLSRLSRADARRVGARRAFTVGAVALVLTPLVVVGTNYQRTSLRGERSVAHRIERALAAAGEGAIVITDNYADSEWLWYYLLGEGWGDERNLRLVHQVPPDEVLASFTRGTGRLATVASESIPIYTATENQARDLADAGLTVTEVDDEVWRIGAPD